MYTSLQQEIIISSFYVCTIRDNYTMLHVHKYIEKMKVEEYMYLHICLCEEN